MDTVLIVDDETSLLLSLTAGFEAFKDKFRVLTAENGKKAIEMLENNAVDLVITDLRMPVVDGYELLAYMASYFPSTPVIVMTAYRAEDGGEKYQYLHSIKLIEKPIEFDELTQSILDHLSRKEKGGMVQGISLGSFLELIEKEGKTCLLKVHSENHEKGLIFMNQGEIWDATFHEKSGDDAVFDLMTLKDVHISFQNLPKKKIKRRITKGVVAFVLESARRMDELCCTEKGNDESSFELCASALTPPEQGKSDLSKEQTRETVSAAYSDDDSPKEDKGEMHMEKLENALMKFKDIEGFNSVGVFSPQGELVSHISMSEKSFEEIGALANDVLLKAQKASEIMGVGRGQLVHIEAPKAHLIVRCLNEATDFSSTTEGRAHIHMVLIIGKEGNLAMAKMKLSSIIQEIAPIFR